MDAYQQQVLNRLKTARGHVGGVIALVEADGYCPDVMKQIAAVQGLLEGASRLMLQRYLETCVAKAMREERTTEIVDELMEALKFDKHTFRPTAPGSEAAGASALAVDATHGSVPADSAPTRAVAEEVAGV